MPNQRRRWARVRAKGVAAHLRTEHGRSQCVVENVSLGGLFVRTDRLEEVGNEIAVDLVKPGWKKQLTLSARVTSRVDALDGKLSKRMPGMGMQFLQLDDKQHERLLQLLRELGAPEEALEITLEEDESATLPEEHAELELRELEADLPPAEPLDPQPDAQQLWKQVQLAASTVETAIESALRDAKVPPPGPVILEEPKKTREPAPTEELTVVNQRLTMQLRGLVMQLSDAQRQIAERDMEIERLKDDLDTARSALERAVRKG